MLVLNATITLSLGRCSHVARVAQFTPLAALPDLSGASRQPAQATGTDQARAADATGGACAGSVLTPCLAQSGTRGLILLDAAGRSRKNASAAQEGDAARFSAETA